MRQAGMKVDMWGYEIISSKHLVGKCAINGRRNMVECFRWVTITKFNMQYNQSVHNV